MKLSHFVFLIGFIAVVICCKQQSLTSGPKNKKANKDSIINFTYPSHFPEPEYDFSKNPLTKKGIELGRMLFYDPILSSDSTIACASCHQPFAAFSHMQHPLSHGVKRNLGDRNTPGIFNLAWSPYFMLDGGIPNLDVLALKPITNPVEMNEKLENVLAKLNSSKVYRSKFKDVYGSKTITTDVMLKSISQFLVSIVSFNSKYDQYMQGKDTLSKTQLRGLALVRKNCTPCHAGELYTDFKFRNIGLDTVKYSSEDLGRERYTVQKSDRRKFKTPTLRNFNLTSPYMHDGRAYGLNHVLAMHDTLIQDNDLLDPLFKQDGKTGIRLTTEEKLDIYFFILTLTDGKMVHNPAYTTPFDRYDIIH